MEYRNPWPLLQSITLPLASLACHAWTCSDRGFKMGRNCFAPSLLCCPDQHHPSWFTVGAEFPVSTQEGSEPAANGPNQPKCISVQWERSRNRGSIGPADGFVHVEKSAKLVKHMASTPMLSPSLIVLLNGFLVSCGCRRQ